MKKILPLLLIIIAAGAVLFFVVFTDSKSEEKEQARMEVIADEAYSMQREIEAIQEDLREKEMALRETSVGIGPTITYGYYISSIEEMQDEGAVVLDANADEELVKAAHDTGREVIYIYNPDYDVPTDADAIILRSNDDSEENRELITDIISCYIDDTFVGIMDNGAVNIPYFYIKTDGIDVSYRYNSISDATIAIFNVSAMENVERLKQKIADGEVEESTMQEMAAKIRENQAALDAQYEEYYVYKAEQEAKIKEIRANISALYGEN